MTNGCLVCDSPLLTGREKFCSWECRKQHSLQALADCVVCGKRVKRRGRKYCSKECRVVHLNSIYQRGDCVVCGKRLSGHQKVTCSTACREAKFAAHPFHHSTKHGPEARALVQQWWGEGKSLKEIGAAIDATPSAVAGLVTRMGLPRRGHPGKWAEVDLTPTALRLRQGRERAAIREGMEHLPDLSEPLEFMQAPLSLEEQERGAPKPVMKAPERAAAFVAKAPGPASTCQWVYGERREDYTTCERPSFPGYSYCPHHLPKAYTRLKCGSPSKHAAACAKATGDLDALASAPKYSLVCDGGCSITGWSSAETYE